MRGKLTSPKKLSFDKNIKKLEEVFDAHHINFITWNVVKHLRFLEIRMHL